MRVVVAGGHGKIALLLERLLAERGDRAVGLIRNPARAADVWETGAEAVICDLEAASADVVAVLLSGADAVVFAAGAGPGSGAPRKDSVDRGASVLLADAAERAGVRGFVQISSMGAGRPPQPGADEVWAAYITVKTAAEADLRSRDLDWTIVRPGGLTGAPAIPRADVAAVIAALLDEPGTRHKILELTSGDSPVAAAVRAVTSARRWFGAGRGSGTPEARCRDAGGRRLGLRRGRRAR
jgi:nucleoside-diphosphate-sugar epimerase